MFWGIVAFLGLALAATWIWLFTRRPSESFSLLQQQITSLTERVNRALGDVSTNISDRLDKNLQAFGHLQERLGRLEEANRQIRSLAEEIAKLQDVLRVPKLRGNLGELFLEELLSQILPRTHYEMQYAFHGGQKVDAIVRLPHKNIVPIDAKFPLENFQRFRAAGDDVSQRTQFRKAFGADFRRHVDAIASKYILPDEGTLDFAFLYIPAENIYYEVIVSDEKFGENESLNNYALSKRVIPVSPSSLYAYLQLIVLGLRGHRIETEARQIIDFLSKHQGDLEKLRDEFDVVGKHLTNAATAFERSEKRLERAQDSIRKVTGGEEYSGGPAPATRGEIQSG